MERRYRENPVCEISVVTHNNSGSGGSFCSVAPQDILGNAGLCARLKEGEVIPLITEQSAQQAALQPFSKPVIAATGRHLFACSQPALSVALSISLQVHTNTHAHAGKSFLVTKHIMPCCRSSLKLSALFRVQRVVRAEVKNTEKYNH